MRLRPIELLTPAFLFLAWPGIPLVASADSPTAVCLPDDNQTCLRLSPAAALELLAPNNPYHADVQLTLARLPGEEVGRVLRALRVNATLANGASVADFAFQNPVELQLGAWSLFQGPASGPAAPGGPLAPVSDMRQWLGVYWDNGQGLIRLGGVSLDENQALCMTVHNAGHYQLIVTKPASALHLSQGSPYPRILTPNGRSNRRAFFFVENPGENPITGTIYDFQGAKVRDLRIDAQSTAPNALTWDGRDGAGNVVPSGPYFYKIAAGDQTVSGGLVVAR